MKANGHVVFKIATVSNNGVQNDDASVQSLGEGGALYLKILGQ